MAVDRSTPPSSTRLPRLALSGSMVHPLGSVAVRGHRRAGAPPAADPSAPVAAARREAEGCFLDRLASPDKPDEVQLAGDAAPTPVTRLLGLASTSSRRLPAEAAAMLGMPDGVSVGAAAAELVLAVNDPAGPRCRSYRAAVYYLRDLHELAAALEDL